MQKLTAVAHRGDPYRVRENTVDSLRSALRRGADAVEIDVRLTRDGVPVLLHDDSLKRLWEHERPLLSLSVDEVRGLTDGGVPTLAEALTATEGSRVLLDLPGTPDVRAARRVVDVVRECGARERVYYCAGASAMLAVRAADPAAEIALTWTTLAPPRPALLDAVRPRWLNYRFGLVDRALAERVHADGCLLSVWTPDTRRSMRRLVGMGVDSITTNRVDILCALRDGALSDRDPRDRDQPREPAAARRPGV
ncbi:glycerophosphodiester phosphodiesterase [Streptomyces sp. NBC_00076]|uniref:glycerophosphodiester phosphodiesterase n=1 Tax=Streptomyces sp. NBC_00076 TaxID=2975642 RepID=UPI00324751E4